jgi:hypothetical protein
MRVAFTLDLPKGAIVKGAWLKLAIEHEHKNDVLELGHEFDPLVPKPIDEIRVGKAHDRHVSAELVEQLRDQIAALRTRITQAHIETVEAKARMYNDLIRRIHDHQERFRVGG